MAAITAFGKHKPKQSIVFIATLCDNIKTNTIKKQENTQNKMIKLSPEYILHVSNIKARKSRQKANPDPPTQNN